MRPLTSHARFLWLFFLAAYQTGGESTKVVDYGVKDEAGISVNLGPGTLEAKAEARFSAETGVTVDYKTCARVGAKI